MKLHKGEDLWERKTFEGEILSLAMVTRKDAGIYLCHADNSIPPSVDMKVNLVVHCKLNLNLKYSKFLSILLKRHFISSQLFQKFS